MPAIPAVTVAAVVQTAGRFLIVEERVNRRLRLNQPAGHVERGETLLEAVVREAREETAWRFEPLTLLGIYLWRTPAAGPPILRFAFSGTVRDHDPTQPLDHGIMRTHWLTPSELSEQRARLRSPLVLRCVEDFLAGQHRELSPVAALTLEAAAAYGGRASVAVL